MKGTMNEKQILKLEKQFKEMEEKFEDIASKVKPSSNESLALESMKRFSSYYDIRDIIISYWKMRKIKASFKDLKIVNGYGKKL